MRVLVWTCRVILVVAIGCFVATVFYLTHDVDMPDAAKAALNWITIGATALVGLIWPLMRRYWQAALLLVSLGIMRALFGEDPGLSTLETPLLTPVQSDFLWISIGVTFLSLVVVIMTRAIISERHLRAMREIPVMAADNVPRTGSAGTREPVTAKEPVAEQGTAKSEAVPSGEASGPVETPPSEEKPAEK